MSHAKQQKEASSVGPSDESGHQEDSDEGSSNLPLNARADSNTTTNNTISSSKPASAAEILVERNARDVLCGRGVQVLHHAGNLHLHLAADEFREEYLGSRRDRKREIIETIVKRLKSTGSRFLKTAQGDKTKWVEANDIFAYQKVSHVLRGQNTGKAVKKIKKQESEVAKQQKEHQQAMQTAATHPISQLANIAMMPNQNLMSDVSMASQAPLDPTSIDTNTLLQNHPLLNARDIASLREANLGMQMLQHQSLQWPAHNLLQSRLLSSTGATASHPNLTNLLTMQSNNNAMFLPHRTNMQIRHQEQQQRLMDMQQSLNNPSAAVLQRLMQQPGSSSGVIAAASQEQQRQLLLLKLQMEHQQSLLPSNNSDNSTNQPQEGSGHVANELVNEMAASTKQDGFDTESRQSP